MDNPQNYPLPDPEPAVSPDDTQPRPVPPASVPAMPIAPIAEPAIAPEDTQPRPVISTLERVGEEAGDEAEEAAPGGCGSPLLVGAVVLAFLCLFVTSVGLAGYAGWRDGVQAAQSRKGSTVIAQAGAQATLAREDCDAGRYELCNERCAYVATQQPSFPGMAACMSLAQIALSATPTPQPTATPAPPTATPTLPSTQAANAGAGSANATSSITGDPNNGGQMSAEELFARGQEAFRIPDYENAMKWLEALRGLNADFHRKEVEDMLVTTYQALGGQYQYEGRLSEMIIVIKKALKIRALPDTGWEFTISAAELYLSAKGYADAGNYELADKIFIKLMDIAPTYLDSKAQACKAFNSAGDTASIKKYGC